MRSAVAFGLTRLAAEGEALAGPSGAASSSNARPRRRDQSPRLPDWGWARRMIVPNGTAMTTTYQRLEAVADRLTKASRDGQGADEDPRRASTPIPVTAGAPAALAPCRQAPLNDFWSLRLWALGSPPRCDPSNPWWLPGASSDRQNGAGGNRTRLPSCDRSHAFAWTRSSALWAPQTPERTTDEQERRGDACFSGKELS